MNSLIDLSHVGFRYDHIDVLSDISARICERDFVVLTGSNGAGKTTLLHLLAGLETPTSGIITRRKGLRIGYLPQYRHIDRQFPITVIDLVLSGLQNSKRLIAPFDASHRAKAEATLSQLQLADLASRPIRALSGGQFQRALLARAIVSEPHLLLLDEPDTHLDASGREFLYDLLEKENAHSAILLVSHDESLTGKTTWQLNNQQLQTGESAL